MFFGRKNMPERVRKLVFVPLGGYNTIKLSYAALSIYIRDDEKFSVQICRRRFADRV